MLATSPPNPLRIQALLRCLTLVLVLSASASTAATELEIVTANGQPLTQAADPTGAVQFEGPTLLIVEGREPVDPSHNVLELEYFCAGGLDSFSIRPGSESDKPERPSHGPLGHSETWSDFKTRIIPPGEKAAEKWSTLHIDLPLPPGRVLQLRNLRVREEIAGEFDQPESETRTMPSDDALLSYLNHDFPAQITEVSVGKKVIQINGRGLDDSAKVFLADIPMDITLGDPRSWQTTVPVEVATDGTFEVEIPRERLRDSIPYDRLTSRWQLMEIRDKTVAPLSHARYADRIACRGPELPELQLRSKKGLGGWHLGPLPNELEDLDISAVTVNVMVHTLISLVAGERTEPITWQGRTYYAQVEALEKLDETFREAQKHDVMVSVILLVANPAKDGNPVVKALGHPDADPAGIFAMPDLTSEEGLSLYGAALNLMAERWSRSDGKFGRVHHWIVHNEVDAGWVWTNAGEKSALAYMDLYHRSMRLTDLIARSYDRHSRPFISLTHHWTHHGAANWYGSRQMIDLLAKFSEAEGDFPWAVAYHPYPQDLSNPRAWEDEQATAEFSTAKITPKNLEVLDAYMKQPALRYRGEVRPVHLSENGFNSRDYSAEQLADQAAGMALAWKKISGLSSIQSWQYHNWIDNRGEGGLKIGLRKFPDDAGEPFGKKPIWHLYQALGTQREDEACAPYLGVIGISSWDDVIHHEPIH